MTSSSLCSVYRRPTSLRTAFVVGARCAHSKIRVDPDQAAQHLAVKLVLEASDTRSNLIGSDKHVMFPWQHRSQEQLETELYDHISNSQFPCVGAKAALAKGNLVVLACNDISSAWDDLRIHDALLDFTTKYQAVPELFRSFAAVFEGPADLSEKAFESSLWKRAQSLSDKDAWRGLSYDDRVSPDPANPHFSLSFGGEAFFIVGLHPQASRPARRFPHPTLVFNLHDQFETLREQGKYEGMREKILKRDEALAGSRNPMLMRFGEGSEARQYSGRRVDDGWEAPFEYHGDKD